MLLSATFISAQGTGDNYIEIEFLSDEPTEYGIRLFGSEDGKLNVFWGDDTESEVTDLKKDGTFLKGTSKARLMKIYGNISTIECSNAPVKDIRVDHMPMLREYITRRTAVSNVDFSKNPDIEVVFIENTEVSELDLSLNARLDSVIVPTNKLKSIVLPENNNISVINCMSNGPLKKMNIGEARNIERLVTIQTNLSEMDLSEMKNLTYLEMGLGMLSVNLKLPVESRLDTLIAPMAGLYEIDLTACKNLKVLSLDNNWGLESIDLSQLPELRVLEAEGCALSEINTSANTKLEYLKCNNTPVTSLDLSNNPELKYLFCFATYLSELDLSACNKLEELDCSYNFDIKALKLPESIYSVDCTSCQLEELEVGHLKSLATLTCAENMIRTLNLGAQHKELTALNANDNLINEIDLKDLPMLFNVNLSNNPIKKLDVSAANMLVLLNINGTCLDVAALDNLYNSLYDASECDYSPILENQVDDASISSTSIATGKGWMVTVEGDGSGSVETSVTDIDGGLQLLNVENGLRIKGIEHATHNVSVYDINGMCIVEKTMKPGDNFVPLTRQGEYIVKINGVKTFKFIHK